MKGLTSSIPKCLPIGARIQCVDNSGAKIVEIISVKCYKQKRRTLSAAGIGDVISVAVKEGKPDIRHKVLPALVVRQKKEFRRPNGLRVKFEDNAAIILNDDYTPKGSIIKGAIARESAERFIKVASIASVVV